MRRLIALFIAFLPLPAMAAQLETDLNGFRLQQYKNVVAAKLGPATKTMDNGDSVVDVHTLDADSYMVFGYDKKRPRNISSIQITGSTRKAIPFKGLLLGDTADRVNMVLGKPTREVGIESPKVTMREYDGANYTVEIDAKKKLYSIQIVTTPELMSKNSSSQAEWNEFKAAVLAKDFKSIATMLRPDLEIYRDRQTLTIKKRFNDFIKEPDKEIIEALIGEKESVFQELQESEIERGLSMSPGAGVVEIYKFKNGKFLKEIVFSPFAGKHRVYEITFQRALGRSRIVYSGAAPSS